MAERALAHIERVESIQPIPGYDRIELATILGWHCIVPKGLNKGDLGVYFEIDSLLPAADERFAFCAKYHYKVKTQKMCKGQVLSQGLFMPLAKFPELAACGLGEDVTARLGVTYYEPEDNIRKATPCDPYKKMVTRHGKLFKRQPFRWLMRREWGKRLLFLFFGRKKNDGKTWPYWVKKTDEDRIQNVPWLLNDKTLWTPTEKIDGSSATYTMRRGKHFWNKPEFIVCSRNVPFRTGKEACYYDTNIYTEIAATYNMREVLERLMKMMPDEEWITIQGEIYGAGVQKRDYGLKCHQFAAFNLILSSRGRVPSRPMKRILADFHVPCVPILGDDIYLQGKTVDEVLLLSDGASTIDGGMREGIVYRSMDGKQSFKAVSNEYLLRYH